MTTAPPKSEFAPPKLEAKRRASMLALKLHEIAESLDERLDDPSSVLELLVNAVAKGEVPSEAWERLHQAAARHDKVSDLAMAYEQVAADKRTKLLTGEQQVYIYLRAARFFQAELGDTDGAIGYAERAAAALPGDAETFDLLEKLYGIANRPARLAELYVDASSRAQETELKLQLLRRAAELLPHLAQSDELAMDVAARILKLAPGDQAAREGLVERLLARGRVKEVIDVLEQALKREPPPGPPEALALRERALELGLGSLKDASRALAHIEGVLQLAPAHPAALAAAESLLESRAHALRAAAALSDAYERSGRTERAIAMLSFELKTVRGSRRVEVQRRLGILRQDVLSDPAGALELLGPVVAGNPGDDALRQRFVALSLGLSQPEQAARLLSRALATSKDNAVRARVGADVGDVYLKSGDVKRAKAAFQQVLDLGERGVASLTAARALCELCTESSELKQLLAALTLVVELEPEREPRQAAARRLARLSEGDPKEIERSIVAFRALIGSPWTDEALRRLEALYRETNDDDGLAEVLFHRAERTKDPEEARALAQFAAELATEKGRNLEGAIELWEKLMELYGATPEVHRKLLPLLVQAKRFFEVCELVEQQIAWAVPADRPALWMELAELRMTRLGDPEGALRAYQEALALEPGHRGARSAVEKLLNLADTRELAAEVLEPVLRAEAPSEGLLRVLEVRAELSPTPGQKLALLREASHIAAAALHDPERALELSGAGLGVALREKRDELGEWLALTLAAREQGSAPHRAAVLNAALGDAPIDSPEVFELAKATGEAYAAAGDLERAVELLSRALVFDPGSRELISRVDRLLAEQGAPEERLELYQSALEQEEEPTRRRELFHALASLQARELGQPEVAIKTLHRALGEDPRDRAAHEALVELLTRGGDLDALDAELRRSLELEGGERRTTTLLRLAELSERRGNAGEALLRYRELCESSDLTDEVLEGIERLAREQGDGTTARLTLERRLSRTADPAARAALLERLGDVLASAEPEAAARAWLEGAELAEQLPSEIERARRLYERVFKLEPASARAAGRLVELSAHVGDWDQVKSAFQVVLPTLEERHLVTLLLGLEERAASSGAAPRFVELVDLALRRGLHSGRARHLGLAKARALATIPGGADLAAKLFRGLVESAGEDAAAHELDSFAEFLSRADQSPGRVADYRWLMAESVKRASSPIELWLKWAEVEEQRFNEPERAVQLLEQVVAADPERTDALLDLSRLKAAAGDAEGAASALRELLPRVDAESRPGIQLKLAALLIGPLGEPEAALDLAESVLAKQPSDAEALRVVHQALGVAKTRARAALLLERMAEGAEDPDARADVIEALLAVAAAAPELAEARSRWMRQLLDTKLDQPEEALKLSLRGAEAAPGDAELWSVAEEMARKLNRPEPVAEAYARTIERELSPAVAETVGRRVVEFHEEWFDDGERVIALLSRVLSLCPTADWAFDRLKLAFNGQGRYAELFQLYDARLDRDLSRAERVELLREAAMAARDFAGDAERAIEYFERLNTENPGDARVEASLERLYERNGKKRPLIALLSLRLGAAVKPAEQNELLGRVAALWLDLSEPGEALALAARLLRAAGGEQDGVALLERIVALPASETTAVHGAPSVRVAAARLLCEHYRAQNAVVDVVRMLEIEADGSAPAERVRLLDEAVELRQNTLGDLSGAFETLSAIVALIPDDRAQRERLARLAAELSAAERQAEVLRSVAMGEVSHATRGSLLLEAGALFENVLQNREAAAELYRGVLGLHDAERGDALLAARGLSGILREGGEPEELATVLERLAELAPAAPERRLALGEAAEVALNRLSDPTRAIVNLEARLKLGADDLEAIDALCKALERAQRFEELVAALERRAELSQDESSARLDRTRAAQLLSRALEDRPRAIAAFRRVRELHGRSPQLFESLRELLAEERDYAALAALYHDEVQDEPDAERRRTLYLELGAVHRHHTGDLQRALEAFVIARDWERAIEVAGLHPADASLGLSVVERLRELSIAVFEAEAAPEALAAADWAVQELCDRRLERGEYETVVSELLDAAKLPFATPRKRELRRDAACLCSDRLNDNQSAIQIFNELLVEEPADEVAGASVTRLSLLLEEQGLHAEIVALWEAQAKAREERGDSAGAALLYARAGENAEQRLGDRERAIASHEAAAALGGEASLAALARIFREQGELPRAADALERLLLLESSELIAERALELLSVYRELGIAEKARPALERAARLAIDAQAVRAALATLYRELSDHAALAGLLAEEAQRTPDRRQRIALLRDAAEIHLGQRNAPAEAAPLLEQAIELEPDDQKLRLRLAQALFACARYEDALRVLREQIQRYGARKPKDRALAHFQLARVLLASGQEPEALLELDAASKIDPAHPGIMQMLGRVAMEQGDLDRAERMFRSLMLIVGREEDPEAPSKTEALLSLSEVALRRGDEARAQELVESAFESSSESGREARALETALRARGRYDLLSRSLESRLVQGAPPGEAAAALADLVTLHAEQLGGLASHEESFRARAKVIEKALADRTERGGDRAFAALGRVYDLLGDREAEERVLELRLAGSGTSSAPPADPDLYFRLARSKLAAPETAGEGLALLDKALDLRLDAGRAARLLNDVSALEADEPARVALKERVARALGDARGLAEVLLVKLGRPGASGETLRELLRATSELNDTELAQRGLQAALENTAAQLSEQETADARLTLASIYAARGELGQSFELREQALGVLAPDEQRAQMRQLAEESARIPSELPRAVRLYRALYEREPQSRELWQPLLLLLRGSGQLAELTELLGKISGEIDDPAQRSQLRLERAELLLQSPGNEEPAIEALFEVIADDPSCVPAVARLRELLVATGRSTELSTLLGRELDRAKDQNDVGRVVALSLELVRLLTERRQLEAGLDVCRAALQWAPSEPDLLHTSLELAEKLGDPALIADALDGLLRVTSGTDAAALGRRLAALREELGDREGAERALEASFSANPRDSSLRDLLIVRYTEREDYTKVAGLLDVSLRERSGDARLLDRLVEAYRAASQPDAALQALDTFMSTAAEDAILLRKRAQLLRELSRDEEAVQALEAAYALDPSLAPDLIDAIERAIARAEPPEDRRLTLRLVELLEAAGDAHGARARLSEFVRGAPVDVEALRRLAELSTRTGHVEHAIGTLGRLVEVETGEELIADALRFADACEQLGRLEEARGALERALGVDRRRPELRQRLQAIYTAIGAVRERAELLLEDAQSSTDASENRRLLIDAAELLLATEDQAGMAVRLLETVRAQDPDNIDAVVLLSRAYVAAGRNDDALALLTGVTESNKGRRIKALGLVYQEIAALHLLDGFLSDALTALTRAFELDPKNGKLAMQLGLQALEIDEDEIAQRAFRGIAIMKAPEPGSTDGATPEMKADANYYLAHMARKAGDPRKAKVLASKALSENPDHEAARALLAEL